MDLSFYDVKGAAEAGAELRLKHPATEKPLTDSAGKPLWIKVKGRDAPSVQAAVKEAERLRAEGKLDKEEAGIGILVASIAGWHPEIEMDGQPLPFTPENAKRLFTDPRTDWIAEQIIPFTIARRNFAANMKNALN